MAPLAAIWLVATKTVNVVDRGFLAFCAAAAIVAALHPAYYYFTIGRLSGLAGATHGKVPNVRRALGSDWRHEHWVDSKRAHVARRCSSGGNASLPGTAPFDRRRCTFRTRRWSVVPRKLRANQELQPRRNTDDQSLCPVAHSADRAVPPASRRGHDAAHASSDSLLIALSCAWSLATFHPDRPEEGGASALATWIWTHHPSLDRPLPEVFVERNRGSERPWQLPAATADCTKLLLMGRGDSGRCGRFRVFPRWCPPSACGRTHSVTPTEAVRHMSSPECQRQVTRITSSSQRQCGHRSRARQRARFS